MDRTLALIKPDAVAARQIGEVLSRIESAGFTLAAMKLMRLSETEASGFYAEHKDRPFFGTLVDFMTSGPLVALVLECEHAVPKWRTLMGATNYKEAEEGTIRKALATSMERNVVHGSDSEQSAEREIAFFFSTQELALT